MADQILSLADDLWSIRGSFRVAKVVDIGTQSTLIRKADGRFVFLDAYTLTGAVKDEVMALTDGGKAVDAVLHLHPFHTVHVEAMAAMFPAAEQVGTRRHQAKAPQLAWAAEAMEDQAAQARFADFLDFTVPRGVDFVPADENLHFASVLALHRASGTLVVDDTLMFTKWPIVGGSLAFHFTLKKVLQPRPGAASDFRSWCDELLALAASVRQVTTAHIHLPPREEPGVVVKQIQAAIDKVEPVVAAHERLHG